MVDFSSGSDMENLKLPFLVPSFCLTVVSDFSRMFTFFFSNSIMICIILCKFLCISLNIGVKLRKCVRILGENAEKSESEVSNNLRLAVQHYIIRYWYTTLIHLKDVCIIFRQKYSVVNGCFVAV